jgi:hypothetical protein
MTDLTTLSLAQITLIGIGALFQVIALCTSVAPTMAGRHIAESQENNSDNSEEDSDADNESLPDSISFGSYGEDTDTIVRPAHLANTAKLTFGQSFKFRSKAPQQHFES